MLETTLATPVLPGSHAGGDPRGAHWIFCLDRLELGRVLCLGLPATAGLETIASLAEEVMVWEPRDGKRRLLQEWLGRGGPSNVSVAGRPQASWQLHELRADLLLPSGGLWNAADLRPFLGPGSISYHEALDAPHEHPTPPGLASLHGTPPLVLRLTPLAGEIRTAVPCVDGETTRWFEAQHLLAPRFRHGLLARAEKALARRGFIAPAAGRLGVLGGARTPGTTRPPAYLRRLAALHGVDIEDHRWGLCVPGDTRAPTLFFYLFGAVATAPEFVVEMVRDPRFNRGIENEHRVLSRWRALSAAPQQVAPEVLFLGHPGHLAAVGRRWLEGEPFVHRTEGTPSCAVARQAVASLLTLGQATAEPVAASAAAAALDTLCTRFAAVYRPPPLELAFLRRQIAALAASPWPVPAVLQHGDPELCNLLVRSDGRVVFLDWKQAEERGMPLWDLLVFLRSYVLLDDVQRRQERPAASVASLLLESHFSPWVRQTLEEYCTRVGVHPTLLEPLFYTCWMARALQEATRLPAAAIGSSRALALLRHWIQGRQGPGLCQLFANGQHTAVGAEGNA